MQGVFHEIAETINQYFKSRADAAAETQFQNEMNGVIDLTSGMSTVSPVGDPITHQREEAEEFEQASIRLRHYTSISGRKGIINEGIIRARDQNSVFAVRARRRMAPRDAEELLGIGRGRANAYIEFLAKPSEFSIIQRQGYR